MDIVSVELNLDFSLSDRLLQVNRLEIHFVKCLDICDKHLPLQTVFKLKNLNQSNKKLKKIYLKSENVPVVVKLPLPMLKMDGINQLIDLHRVKKDVELPVKYSILHLAYAFQYEPNSNKSIFFFS